MTADGTTPARTTPDRTTPDRTVSARLLVEVDEPATLELAIAAAQSEASPTMPDRARRTRVDLQHGTVTELVELPRGTHELAYEARIEGRDESIAAVVESADLIRYGRASRYCESDALIPTAQAEFAGLEGRAAVEAVRDWVADRLDYVAGSTTSLDTAVSVLLSRRGVCRDYAHLTIALIRALDIPARLVAVYAPQLEPMDFHAVVEAYIEGAWHVVDATGLAPRAGMARIATGLDAAETAFMTVTSGVAQLRELEVRAAADEPLPSDDGTALIRLG
ncbi:transglutaminase-like domain-containing protein [Homoserinibacter sp. YIM 151385]|uniref:transglutaminase-like domain-containing protein n=1 Tax=Homoserinibacter sp. YIM 151385 TaxID=2985506 RepID=UPI0022F00810|nr:transglutaminase-like domain-containing protein [Homoserinibacter sp. YIM 151385]WBU37596.1 transglutaminase-like domain-containing protein [Homoserinibacter sp. YIM 151385]